MTNTPEAVTETGQNRPPSLEDYFIQPRHDVAPGFLDAVAAHQTFLISGKPYSFEDIYTFMQPGENKYSVACAVIHDERIDPQLVKIVAQNFFPPDQKQEEKDLIMEDRDHQLHNNLKLRLIARGVLDPYSLEAQGAFGELERIIERNAALSDMRTKLPDNLQDAALAMELFKKMSTPERIDEIRSWMVSESFLRKYVGDLAVYKPTGDIDFQTLMNVLPSSTVQDLDTALYNIIQREGMMTALKLFANGEETRGFQVLEDIIRNETDEAKRYFDQHILDELTRVHHKPFPDGFVHFLKAPPWTNKEFLPFPLLPQKLVIDEFEKTRAKLVIAPPGSGKTAMGYGAMKQIGAKHFVVIGPAKARETWVNEANTLFEPEKRPSVFTVKNETDLDNPEINTADVVFFSVEFLAQAQKNPTRKSKLESFFVPEKKEYIPGGIIVDESHKLKDYTSQTSQVVMELLPKARARYEQETGKRMPMMALTATPISTSFKNLDVTMALLYPQYFAIPGDSMSDKNTFSHEALLNPQFGHDLIYGEKLIFTMDMEHLFGEKAPRFEYEIESIPITPSQEVVSDWIEQQQVTLFEKSRPLEGILIYPELARQDCLRYKWIPEPILSRPDAVQLFGKLHDQWIQWHVSKPDDMPDQHFGRDWIAKWDSKSYLQLELNPNLPDGFFTLVQLSPHIRADWEQAHPYGQPPSPKLEYIYHLVKENIEVIDGKQFLNIRPLIVSPEYKEGITQGKELITLLDIFQEWFPELSIVGIDGETSFTSRQSLARDYRETDKIDGVIATERSINESMNWAVEKTKDTKHLHTLYTILLSCPWTYDRLRQMFGRKLRPGLAFQLRNKLLEVEKTMEYGKRRLVHFEDLLTRVFLSGAKLVGDDLALFQSKHKRKEAFITDHPRTRALFLRDTMKRAQGIGEQQIVEQFSREREGKSLFRRFAEAYYDDGNDERRFVGHNAGLAADIISASGAKQVISIGAGTCLAARALERKDPSIQVTNTDINPEILALAKEKHPNIGEIKTEAATNISLPDESQDFAEASFMTHWLQLYTDKQKKTYDSDTENIERVKFLKEFNRVQKLQHGEEKATGILSFVESAFDDDSFKTFTHALEEHFGFTVIQKYSGESYALVRDEARRIGWIITVQKIAPVGDISGLNPHALATKHDEAFVISKVKEEKQRPKPAAQRIDYPIFVTDTFEIHNPLTGESTSSKNINAIKNGTEPAIPPADQSIPSNGIIFVTPENGIQIDVKTIKHRLPFAVSKWARKTVTKKMGIDNYEQADTLAIEVLQEAGLLHVEHWFDPAAPDTIDASLQRQFNEALSQRRKPSQRNV